MQRIVWIDYAKIIGLFLVIFAHLYTSEGIGNINVVRSYIYGFHMPCFFLISGCLYKIRKGGLRQAISINVKRLLIPYICLNLLFALFYGIISGNLIHQFLSFPSGLIKGGNTPCGASWFVVTLFFIKCIYDFLSYNKIEKYIIPLIFISTVLIHYLHLNHNYFYLKSTLIGICFFHLGRLSLDPINRIKSNSLTSLIASIALFMVSYYLTMLNGTVSVYSGSMGNSFVLFYANAIIGTAGIIALSFLGKEQKNTITEISKGSIAVVLLHMVFVQGTRIVVKHFDISGISLFLVYAVSSVIIYLLCFMIFKVTNKRIPFIWGN